MTRANDVARRAVSAAPATPKASGAPALGPPTLLTGMPPPVPARARRGRLSSKFGTVNYSVDEMRRLNDKVRAVLPVSADEWLHVAYLFNYLRPDSIPYREVESLKRKFKKMYCARSNSSGGGSGNADASAALPDYLVEAKTLRQLINQRSDKAQSEDAQSDLGAATEDPAMDHAGISGGGGDGSSSQAGVEEDAEHSGDASVGSNAAASAAASTTAGSHSAATDSEGRPTTMLLAEDLRDDGAGGEALAMGRSETQELRPVRVHSGAIGGHQQQQQHALELPVDGLADGGGSLASRLRQMEDDYQRSVMLAASSSKKATKGSEGHANLISELPVASQQPPALTTTPTASSSASELHSPTSASAAAAHQALVPPGVPLSTTGIISMLKHSIERKRRTVEEQMLHESVRVRKERKKRKMEQALYSIHQEQREREATGAVPVPGAATTTSSGSEARLPPSPSHHTAAAAASSGLSHPLFQSPATLMLSGANVADTSSLGLMEIMLQYMTAQQLETARRHELEDERQRREEVAREERRRAKDQQRRRKHQELMLALSAMLGDKFPPSLRHLVDSSSAPSVDERGGSETPSSLMETDNTREDGDDTVSVTGDKERDAIDANAQLTGAVEHGAPVLL